MAKAKEVYVCTNCGFETAKWNGRCPSCNEWNTFELHVQAAAPAKGAGRISAAPLPGAAAPVRISEIDTEDEVRYHTGLKEFDRVLGGGIVKGSINLLSGAPGIGKSTLLLQICEFLGRNYSILYVSGEESVRQLKLRAQRLGVESDNLYIVSQTDVDTVIHTVVTQKPDLVMIDSIQTMNLAQVASSAGSVTQVRECTSALMRTAKSEEIPMFIVGHINKDGAIAGPKVLEHIVDAVLYFEGDRNLTYRILRAVKNRYGSTNEIGMFEMLDTGLTEVENPSMMLLADRPVGVSGTCAACVMEGSRPIMAEVQALVTKTGFGTPRRMAAGFDYNRMSLILAVLEKRAGYFFGALDVYINIVGGLRLEEPAADLSIALALVSSLRDKPLPEGLLAFGELGLAGEIRTASNLLQRIKEAQRLGFTQCLVPRQALKALSAISGLDGIELIGVSSLKQAIAAAFPG
ncbi:MAG: DNA repair protein RadA [Oscillospiraceae bacterium]|nr:DNA repair protein RadA [Oscillospiraceae bacterium]